MDFYVSTTGNDAWSGTVAEPNAERTDGPFATIAGARDAVRRWKEEGRLDGPATVLIRGGRYRVSEPLVLTPDDSGPVTYVAYAGEEPVIDGGRPIESWQEQTVNGVRMWVAELPEVVAGDQYFRQLFVNGSRRERTRLPKQGYYWMKDVPATNKNQEDAVEDLFDGSDTFVCAPGDIQAWHNLTDVDVVTHHFWIEERMPIQSFEAGTDTVTSSRKSMFVLRDDIAKRFAKYYVENVFEALRDPGEWYLDRTSGKLYYIPLEEDTIGGTEAYAGLADQLLILAGDPDGERYVENIAFRGITFVHTDWHQPPGGGEEFGKPGTDFAASPQAAYLIPGVIRLTGARNCTIEDCRIAHIGWYGIELADGCTSNRIVGNTIRDMGAGGVKINGSDADGPPARRTGNNTVTDNLIHGGGRVFPSAVGILSRHAYGNTISHNHIHDLYYTAISCGWVWGYAENVSKNNAIEHNYIHDIGHSVLSDMGGIYTLGVQPGTVIRGNLIHDIEKCNYGGWAIYPDEGSAHMLIENNICYNTSSQVFHEHYGRENIVRNNIFAFGREGQAALSRAEAHVSFTFMKNIVISDRQPLYATGYGATLERGAFHSDLNLFWDVSGEPPASGKIIFDEKAMFSLGDGLSFEQLQVLGYDRHSVFANPRMKDLASFDFTLGDDSPALALGFKPIDMSGVGPRPAGKRDEGNG